MNISHSLTAHITSETFINCYHNGNGQSCTFIENGNSLSIHFEPNCIQKLSEIITKLQEINEALVKLRQRQITREFEQLSLSGLRLPVHITNGSFEEVEISFQRS